MVTSTGCNQWVAVRGMEIIRNQEVKELRCRDVMPLHNEIFKGKGGSHVERKVLQPVGAGNKEVISRLLF